MLQIHEVVEYFKIQYEDLQLNDLLFYVCIIVTSKNTIPMADFVRKIGNISTRPLLLDLK